MSGDKSKHVPTLFRRGVEALGRRRFLQARGLLVRAVDSGGPAAVWAGQELIQTFLRRGEVAEVEPFLHTILAPDSSHLHHLLGYLYRRAGRSDEAQAQQELALKAEPGLVPALIELGWLQVTSGRDAVGQRNLDRAARVAAEDGDDWGQATALAFLATRALARFDLRQAVILLPRAVALMRRSGDTFRLARALSNSGLTHYYLANYVQAIADLRAAIALERQIGDRDVVARTWNNLGNCYRELHDLPRADEAYRKAVAAGRRSVDHSAIGGALGNLASVRLLRGARRSAERLYAASLKSLAGSPDPDAVGATVFALMSAQTTGGRPVQALNTLASYAEQVTTANARTRSNLAQEEARALLRLGRLDEAKGAITLARREACRVPGPQQRLFADRITIEAIAARIEIAACKPGSARRILGGAERRVESLLAGLGGSILRMGLLEASRAVVDAQVECQFAQGRSGIRHAWQISAAAKARELRDTLHQTRPVESGEHLAVRDEIEAEARRLAAATRIGPAELRQLKRLQRRYLEALEHGDVAREDSSDRSTALHPRPSLDAETAILEYHVADAGTLAFSIHQGIVRCVHIEWDRERLTGAVERFTRPLLGGLSGGDVWAELDGFDLELGNALYHKLVEPAIAGLPAGVTRLVITPDGPLRRLPFDALVRALPEVVEQRPFARFAQAHYLGDDWIVSYALSSRLLVVPTPANTDPRLLSFAYSPATGARLLTGLGPRSLGPLPGATAEARSLARVFSRGRALTGSRATIAAYQRMAADADIVHLATHAFADPLTPGLSGLVLAGRGRDELDFLSAERVARIPLRASLVTLSACDTGNGRDYGREGVIGIARSFLQAGATAVLASLWPVDDLATGDLMQLFYRQLVAGQDRAQALATARKSLRYSTSPSLPYRAHPYFWAAMVLIDHSPGKWSLPGAW